MNTFGTRLRLTTFGESHGVAVGGVLDGFPPGIELDRDKIMYQLWRRIPHEVYSTARIEIDEVSFLSGIMGGVTTGTPIAFWVENIGQRSQDYDSLEDLYRPSHADYVYEQKYGIRDPRGGGRSSARETVARVIAGSMAQQLLSTHGVEVCSYTDAVAGSDSAGYLDDVTPAEIEQSRVGCPIPELDRQMYELLTSTEGDTLGATVATVVRGVSVGWGEPLYDKLSARLTYALMSINAAKGVEIGDGFALAQMRGSEANDPYVSDNGQIRMLTNHSGGILAGISTGEVLRMRTAFKPISSISLPQKTVARDGRPTVLRINGRHDTSVVPRVLPVVDAMVALVLADFMIQELIPHQAK